MSEAKENAGRNLRQAFVDAVAAPVPAGIGQALADLDRLPRVGDRVAGAGDRDDRGALAPVD